MIRDAFAFDAAAIAQIQVDAWRASYADIISQQTLSRLSVQSITRQWEQWFFTPGREQICLVHVSNTGKVLGYAMGGASRTHQSNAHLARAAGRAEIQVLYVAPDIKGQGVGRALMQGMARRFDRQGWRSMEVWSLEANPSAPFYRRMGGLQKAARVTQVNGQALPEIRFDWPTLKPLLHQTELTWP